jgi:hypothetical protein
MKYNKELMYESTHDLYAKSKHKRKCLNLSSARESSDILNRLLSSTPLFPYQVLEGIE